MAVMHPDGRIARCAAQAAERDAVTFLWPHATRRRPAGLHRADGREADSPP
ncbi:MULTISPECIES: hypothetical protein [Streptomyces]|uniref:Uncharacterized protein n=1 Tax=Streptomyces ehimensis TaxID=68195 RepID=A0ABV9BNQ9_9ACTN|nr:hypothetical protein [Streptomyces luteoverticillatus]